jgi:Kdo2-lipid IVA lauroyltransferase/acyltransferase
MSLKNTKSLRINLAGLLVYYVFPFRKKVLKDNLDRVFKTASSSEKTRLMKSFYTHIMLTIKEFLFYKIQDKTKLLTNSEVIGLEHLYAAKQEQKGIILLTGHFGNWEFGPIILSNHAKELQGKINIVRKKLRTKMMENLLFNRHRKKGINIITSQGALSKLVRSLKKNEVVIFPMDQYANTNRRHGIFANFMGHSAGTHSSVAFLAYHTGAAVVPVKTYREKNKHVVKLYPSLEWQEAPTKEQAIAKNTNSYNKVLEQFVLSQPEQWLWTHRRWKVK